MNLHWGKTLANKRVRLRSKPLVNYTMPFYNATEYKAQRYYYWEDTFRNTTYNGSSIHAKNQFLKKSRILTDLIGKTVKGHSFTTVVVIASIFLFLTMTITAAVVVFCRKRNTVFALQKSEQETDIEYELEELNTDIEYTETEFESETDSLKLRQSVSQQGGDSDFESSPARRPLVPLQRESEADESPIRYHRCQCGATADPRGAYQQMMVTAVLEKPLHHASASEDSDAEITTRYLKKLNKTYYGFATVPSDVESDHESYSMNMRPPPMINITYVDDPPSYESIQHASQQQVTVQIENCQLPSNLVRQNKMDLVYQNSLAMEYGKKSPYGASVVFVELPPENCKKRPLDGSDEPVVFVNLPPKPDSSGSSDAMTPTEEMSEVVSAAMSVSSSVTTTPSTTPTVTPITSPTQVLPPPPPSPTTPILPPIPSSPTTPILPPIPLIPTTPTLPPPPPSPTTPTLPPPPLSPTTPTLPPPPPSPTTPTLPPPPPSPTTPTLPPPPLSPTSPMLPTHPEETDSSSDAEQTVSTNITAETCSSPSQCESQTEPNSMCSDSSTSRSDSEPG